MILQIGWYNEFVQEICRLSYPDDTLGLCVISTPEMFEKAFIPFVKQQDCDGIRDPIDQCMVHYFNKVKEVGGGIIMMLVFYSCSCDEVQWKLREIKPGHRKGRQYIHDEAYEALNVSAMVVLNSIKLSIILLLKAQNRSQNISGNSGVKVNLWTGFVQRWHL